MLRYTYPILVMRGGEAMQDLEIVCTTTGTKCFSWEYFSFHVNIYGIDHTLQKVICFPR